MDVLGDRRAGRGGRGGRRSGGDHRAPRHGGSALNGNAGSSDPAEPSTTGEERAGSSPAVGDDASARERILTAAQELFAERGFDATPTSRIAELAGVPKGLVHYYFRRKPDLLVALVGQLPREHIDHDDIVVAGDIAGSLRRLVAALDAWLDTSPLLSHLLWREADTHDAVRDALTARFRWMVGEIRAVMAAALDDSCRGADVPSAAELLALAVSYRHSTARHVGAGPELEPLVTMHRELGFLADALVLGAGATS